jgi:hypothetical protein
MVLGKVFQHLVDELRRARDALDQDADELGKLAVRSDDELFVVIAARTASGGYFGFETP